MNGISSKREEGNTREKEISAPTSKEDESQDMKLETNKRDRMYVGKENLKMAIITQLMCWEIKW